MSDIKQMAGHWEMVVRDNMLVFLLLAFAVLLAAVVFGGLLLEYFINKKRERAKAKAIERLHKHLESLPSVKS